MTGRVTSGEEQVHIRLREVRVGSTQEDYASYKIFTTVNARDSAAITNCPVTWLPMYNKRYSLTL